MILSLPRLTAALLALVLAVTVPCQGGSAQVLPPLSSSPDHHLDAKISPDGQTVLYRTGPGKIGRVSTVNGAEIPLVVSAQNNLFDYLWAPNSLDVYFLQGNQVRSISRSGGSSLLLATIAGTNVRIWCVDADGVNIWGTRRENGLHHIFSLDTSGGLLPVDVLSSPNVLDDVRVDPSGSSILYRSGSAQPFAAKEYYRADADGQNEMSLLATFSGDSADWADAGQNFVLSAFTPTVPPAWGIGRVDSAGVLEFLTDADALMRRTSVSADGQWILFEARNPRDGGVIPGVMPATGGGAVMLYSGQNLILNGGSLTGGLSMDHDNSLVAFSASFSDFPGTPDQVFLVALDREVRIHPRVEVGRSFTVELPVEMGELGALAFSVGVETGTPLTVPGINGAFELLAGPGQFAVVLIGQGDGNGPLTVQGDVPNLPRLIGSDIFFQGLRIPESGPGAFTHWGWFTIF